MKANAYNHPSGKNKPLDSYKRVLPPIVTLALVLLTSVLLYLYNNSAFPILIPIHGSIPLSHTNSSSTTQYPTVTTNAEQKCDIFRGNWVFDPKGPYYTNETNCVIDDRQNCMKSGRTDTEFMKWRWKPDDCELPLFNAVQFLAIVRGKTLAFVGDSVARNQMQSLTCLLASAAYYPVDVSYVEDTTFRRWLYKDFNFTIIALWSPNLVKAQNADPDGFSFNSLMNLYLDEADEAWATQVENVDIVIISAGQWFFRPFMYYENGGVVGCHICHRENVTELTNYYAYKMAFRTAFRTLLGLRNYKGLTFLRTFSPSHFENGEWNKGGNCVRTRPSTKEEMKLDGYALKLYKTQVEELRTAEIEGKKRGLRFRLLDTTEAMVLRPDGHPNHIRHYADEKNNSIADCVHWCMPGPIDTWNEFLLQMLKREG